MFVTISIILVKLDEFSNLISAFFIQIFLWIIVIYFIKHTVQLWLNGELVIGDNSDNNGNRIPEKKLMAVHIPFTFKLKENPSTGFREIGCLVSSDINYRFFAFWGVSIDDLHRTLWRPWFHLLEDIKHGKLLEKHFYKYAGQQYKCGDHGEKLLRMKFPPLEYMNFGIPPRTHYPLVICLVTDLDWNGTPEEIVMLISVIHIKDKICTLPTSLLSQYIKQAGGPLLVFQPLYMATPINCEGDVAEQLCVVCQQLPLSRGLLPCRHTCICAFCSSKLVTCPLCRCKIDSFIIIKNEDYMEAVIKQIQEEQNNSGVQRVAEWFNNLEL